MNKTNTMNMKNTFKLLAISCIASVAFSACEKKDDKTTNDEGEELITTVELTFTDNISAKATTFNWTDADGPGGDNPIIDNITLSKDIEYQLSIRFLNESVTPAEDITDEVREEGNDHLICFSNTSNMTVTSTDKDSNDLPIGLTANVNTTGAINGFFELELRHQPGVKTGDCELGSADIDVMFPINFN